MLTLSNILAAVAIAGATGSVIELIGDKFNLPRVSAFGKAIEAATADLPKIITNLFTVVKGK